MRIQGSVNGHWEIRLGGLVISGWRPPDFQAGGRQFPPVGGVRCSGDRPLAGEDLGEPVRVALGQHQVGVVEHPVDGGGGERRSADNDQRARGGFGGRVGHAQVPCGPEADVGLASAP